MSANWSAELAQIINWKYPYALMTWYTRHASEIVQAGRLKERIHDGFQPWKRQAVQSWAFWSGWLRLNDNVEARQKAAARVTFNSWRFPALTCLICWLCHPHASQTLEMKGLFTKSSRSVLDFLSRKMHCQHISHFSCVSTCFHTFYAAHTLGAKEQLMSSFHEALLRLVVASLTGSLPDFNAHVLEGACIQFMHFDPDNSTSWAWQAGNCRTHFQKVHI